MWLRGVTSVFFNYFLSNAQEHKGDREKGKHELFNVVKVINVVGLSMLSGFRGQHDNSFSEIRTQIQG